MKEYLNAIAYVRGALVLGLGVACVGCISTPMRQSCTQLSEQFPAIELVDNASRIGHYDAMLTWSDYDCFEGDPEDATYYWNDQWMGNGTKAFRLVLVELALMNDNSRILIFPSYNDEMHNLPSGNGPPCHVPFINDSNNMDRIGQLRSMTFIYSTVGPARED